MTKIKLCGLTRPEDIRAANALMPDYVGFVFARGSRRCVTPERAAELKALLIPSITAVGVFVNERPERVAELMRGGVIDAAQLHGDEDDEYVAVLKRLSGGEVIRAFRVRSAADAARAERSAADRILLDAGAGDGVPLDLDLVAGVEREYFLAGGLDARNVRAAIRRLSPYAVDVSSGIESDGIKDEKKMAAFVAAVRQENDIT